MPLESTASLIIKPSASYAVDITATVKNRSSWVELGDMLPSPQCSESHAQDCNIRQLQLHFNTSGIVDGTTLVEDLILTGMAQGLSADPASVSISVQVISSPSFDLSTIDIPQTVTTGEAAGISISPVDTEGLNITEARGRFVRLELE